MQVQSSIPANPATDLLRFGCDSAQRGIGLG